jgi:hypothetical protein
VVFSPEPLDRLAARRRFYHGLRISKQHDACVKAPASRSRYSLQFLAEPLLRFQSHSVQRPPENINSADTFWYCYVGA